MDWRRWLRWLWMRSNIGKQKSWEAGIRHKPTKFHCLILINLRLKHLTTLLISVRQFQLLQRSTAFLRRRHFFTLKTRNSCSSSFHIWVMQRCMKSPSIWKHIPKGHTKVWPAWCRSQLGRRTLSSTWSSWSNKLATLWGQYWTTQPKWRSFMALIWIFNGCKEISICISLISSIPDKPLVCCRWSPSVLLSSCSTIVECWQIKSTNLQIGESDH